MVIHCVAAEPDILIKKKEKMFVSKTQGLPHTMAGGLMKTRALEECILPPGPNCAQMLYV